jgi:hypothetical protein
MRKRLITDDPRDGREDWLDLTTIARVELTSEEADHPIESALSGAGAGWRAAHGGEQRIRLLFDQPLHLRRIVVGFDVDTPRTQEFVVRWSPDDGRTYRDVVRQQYTFSPPETTRELEDYAVDLPQVTVLELRIAPDIGGGSARASLRQLRLA